MPKEIYAFIDCQNLKLGIYNEGWNLDFKRFRVYLKDKYNVNRAFLFMGFVNKNQRFYNYLSGSGYEIIFKQTTLINTSKGKILNCIYYRS